ncbi:AraD1 family protein [Noviherbaspirillum galbum]|uniref:FAH family protein n=1 Tax=Noviherbaspirillum galbum TaxID=2709383 RepID=A0A6B3SKI2_9BURK|nr:AraD1 family protein [Noviherbaspirillum galbum]NEX61260.1 FAH family protein [Noviherbaspirillum galbum]
MRLIQFLDLDGQRRVGMIDAGGERVAAIRDARSMRRLALDAIAAGRNLEQEIRARGVGASFPYAPILDECRILVPLDHEDDPAHCMVSGTGLTHLASASLRDAMHHDHMPAETMTDSMRMFRLGLEGGRPPAGAVGAQPEWFYKGDGGILVHPGQDISIPAFAEDAGEESELAGLYVIGPDRQPYRIGFAGGNEFSDHLMERRNYLYLAHSKLRNCSFGPELLVGELPPSVAGTSRIFRGDRLLWERRFATGREHMSHSIENLEYHHFKYAQFLRPGSVHVHFFGSAVTSFSDGVATREGDVFEISLAGFGAPLRNAYRTAAVAMRPGEMAAL